MFPPMTRDLVTSQDKTEYHYDQSNSSENSYYGILKLSVYKR